jgi:hypothetical protein
MSTIHFGIWVMPVFLAHYNSILFH